MSHDAQANAAAREAARRKKAADETPPLEPAFPFVREHFDPFFFGVENDPGDEEEE